MNGDNTIEMELTAPLPIQYATLRVRAARTVPLRFPTSATTPTEDPADRVKAYDDLADELAQMVKRETERITAQLRGK